MATDKPSANDDNASASSNVEREEQKPFNADMVDDDDPHKVEKLTKAGRDIDPSEGSE